ncbi:SpaA isopeptide-forming pilin-related protein, partial [Enterococcus cecorum]|uniref:SpaA isopeptide-forming pilin-related protein n=1 Tax=Enterococcus cecorum TaxID=44008 RepID=UPI00200B7445
MKKIVKSYLTMLVCFIMLLSSFPTQSLAASNVATASALDIPTPSLSMPTRITSGHGFRSSGSELGRFYVTNIEHTKNGGYKATILYDEYSAESISVSIPNGYMLVNEKVQFWDSDNKVQEKGYAKKLPFGTKGEEAKPGTVLLGVADGRYFYRQMVRFSPNGTYTSSNKPDNIAINKTDNPDIPVRADNYTYWREGAGDDQIIANKLQSEINNAYKSEDVYHNPAKPYQPDMDTLYVFDNPFYSKSWKPSTVHSKVKPGYINIEVQPTDKYNSILKTQDSFPVRISAYLPENKLGAYFDSNKTQYVTIFDEPVIYCYNRYNAPAPEELSEQAMPLLNRTNFMDNTVPDPAVYGTKNMIQWVLYGGYPFDNARIADDVNSAYKIATTREDTNMEQVTRTIRAATQAAIWYFTDGIKPASEEPGAKAAAEKLIQYAKEHANEDLPKEIGSYYIDNNKKVFEDGRVYQNFVGLGRIIADNGPEINLSLKKEDDKGGVTNATFDVYKGILSGDNESLESLTKINSVPLRTENGKLDFGQIKFKINTPYTIVETESAEGFGQAEPITFCITDEVGIVDAGREEYSAHFNGKYSIFKLVHDVTDSKEKTKWIKMEGTNITFNKNEISSVKPELLFKNYPKGKVKIQKVDSKTLKGLSGAKFTIKDYVTNKEIKSFESKETAEELSLSKERLYKLSETKAPEGYRKIKDIIFKIDKDGTVRFTKKEGTPFEIAKDGKIVVKNYNESEKYIETQVLANGKTGLIEISGSRPIKVVDKITYHNLTPNKEYTIHSKLMVVDNEGNAKPATYYPKDKGNVEHITKFTPTEKDGDITVNVGADGEDEFSLLINKQVPQRFVVYEKISSSDEEVILHEDPRDSQQTFMTKDYKGNVPPALPDAGELSIKTVVSYLDNNSGEIAKSNNDQEMALLRDDFLKNENYILRDVISTKGIKDSAEFDVRTQIYDKVNKKVVFEKNSSLQVSDSASVNVDIPVKDFINNFKKAKYTEILSWENRYNVKDLITQYADEVNSAIIYGSGGSSGSWDGRRSVDEILRMKNDNGPYDKGYDSLVKEIIDKINNKHISPNNAFYKSFMNKVNESVAKSLENGEFVVLENLISKDNISPTGTKIQSKHEDINDKNQSFIISDKPVVPKT